VSRFRADGESSSGHSIFDHVIVPTSVNRSEGQRTEGPVSVMYLPHNWDRRRIDDGFNDLFSLRAHWSTLAQKNPILGNPVCIN
jgi:hypothetical protein